VSLFGVMPSWKEKAYIFMAVDTTMKGLAYIIPKEVIGFEVPTIRGPETIMHRTIVNLNRAYGFLQEVTGEKGLAKYVMVAKK